MNFLKTYQSYIRLLPIFLLTLGCGIDSGILIILSGVCYSIVCKVYHEPFISELAKSKVFKLSCFAIGVWLASMIIPSFWNGGNFSVIWKYVGRMAPFFMVSIMGKKNIDTLFAVWIGITIAAIWYCIDTVMHPYFLEDANILTKRLMGAFGWPNSLANVMSLLIPFVMFGVIKYWKDKHVLGLIGLSVSIAGAVIIILTVSRNAYIVSLINVALLTFFLFLSKDWISIRIVGLIILIASCVLLNFAPPVFYQRLNQNLENDGRVYLLTVSAQLYEEHPYIGIGIGNWGNVYKERFELPGKEKNMDSPHNIYLQTMNESGIIGLFGFLTLLGFQIWILIKDRILFIKEEILKLRWTAGVLLIILTIIVSGFFDYDFFSRHPMHLYWFYWGIAVFDMHWHIKE